MTKFWEGEINIFHSQFHKTDPEYHMPMNLFYCKKKEKLSWLHNPNQDIDKIYYFLDGRLLEYKDTAQIDDWKYN